MSTIRISGALADRYHDYRDFCALFGPDELLASYRKAVVDAPKKFDVATIAAVLHDGRITDSEKPSAWAKTQAVRFATGASDALVRALDAGDPALYGDLRNGLEVQSSAREVIVACERAGAVELLESALALLFIEAHPRLVEVVAHEAMPDDGDADDDASSDERPPGYPGGDDRSDGDASPSDSEE